jgi:hypothetical protein
MKRKLKSYAGALVFVAWLTSCSEAPTGGDSGQTLHYTDPSEQQRLKTALERARIPFEVRSGAGGREEIRYESRLEEQVTRVRNEVFGVPPPMGRSISLGRENAILVEALKQRNASFWIAKYHEDEYVAWSAGVTKLPTPLSNSCPSIRMGSQS